MRRFESKKKYSKISYVKRVKLIQLVEEEGLGVTKAAKQLRIKIPTAKVILSNYRKKGIIYRKKNELESFPAHVKPQDPEVKKQHVQPEVYVEAQQTIKPQAEPFSLFIWICPQQMPSWPGPIHF